MPEVRIIPSRVNDPLAHLLSEKLGVGIVSLEEGEYHPLPNSMLIDLSAGEHPHDVPEEQVIDIAEAYSVVHFRNMSNSIDSLCTVIREILGSYEM